MENDKKIRMFELVQNVELIDIDLVKNWLDNLECSYLWVLHDKDDTRNHYHIYVKMVGARSISDIASQCKQESNYFQFIKNWKNALAYAFHLMDNKSTDEKYKYNKDAVIYSKNINVDDVFNTDAIIKEKELHTKYVLDLISQYGEAKISKKTLLESISCNDYIAFSDAINKAYKYRCQITKNRNMQVIYITGVSGSGKTELAKYIASQNKLDYFISGSGSDVLDNYDKEECIILDDFRADAFTKSELFKLCDNHTDSSVKSRYSNKNISFCKLLIITSIKNPRELYNWNDANDFEPFKQFARRINNEYLFVDDESLVFKHDLITNQELLFIDFKPLLDDIIKEKESKSVVIDALGIFNNGIIDYSLKYIRSDNLPF